MAFKSKLSYYSSLPASGRWNRQGSFCLADILKSQVILVIIWQVQFLMQWDKDNAVKSCVNEKGKYVKYAIIHEITFAVLKTGIIHF